MRVTSQLCLEGIKRDEVSACSRIRGASTVARSTAAPHVMERAFCARGSLVPHMQVNSPSTVAGKEGKKRNFTFYSILLFRQPSAAVSRHSHVIPNCWWSFQFSKLGPTVCRNSFPMFVRTWIAFAHASCILSHYRLGLLMHFNVTPLFPPSINNFFLISRWKELPLRLQKKALKKAKCEKNPARRIIRMHKEFALLLCGHFFVSYATVKPRCIARQSAIWSFHFQRASRRPWDLCRVCIRIYRKPIWATDKIWEPSKTSVLLPSKTNYLSSSDLFSIQCGIKQFSSKISKSHLNSRLSVNAVFYTYSIWMVRRQALSENKKRKKTRLQEGKIDNPSTVSPSLRGEENSAPFAIRRNRSTAPLTTGQRKAHNNNNNKSARSLLKSERRRRKNTTEEAWKKEKHAESRGKSLTAITAGKSVCMGLLLLLRLRLCLLVSLFAFSKLFRFLRVLLSVLAAMFQWKVFFTLGRSRRRI